MKPWITVAGALLMITTSGCGPIALDSLEPEPGSGMGSGGSGGIGNGSGGLGSGGSGGIGNGSGGLGSGGVGGGTCTPTHYEGQRPQVDLHILLDKSGSMGLDNKWLDCTTALKAFLQSPQVSGAGMGIQYFPLSTTIPIPPQCQMCTDCNCVQNCGCGSCTCPGGSCMCVGMPDSCQLADYAAPAVEIALLPGNAQALINSTNSVIPNGGTPTRLALEGALSHARDWAVAHPDHKVVTVLATDGTPTTCQSNTIPDAAAVAGLYFNSTPSIPTYVIGIGSVIMSLDPIAQSGGTTMEYWVDKNFNTTQKFLDAMDAILDSARSSCEYLLPVPMGGPIDISKINVQYMPGGGGSPVFISHVQSAAECNTVVDGWYYDNNSAPTRIVLCPATCMTVENDSMGKIDILYGCP